MTAAPSFHPVADIFPLIQGEAFDALVLDIRAHGLRVPIVLHPDGRILDGRNRFRACTEAGVEPRFEAWDGDGLAADYVWSLNGPRRHLDGGALEIAAGRYAIEREAEAKERQGARTDRTSAPNGAEVEFGRSREKAAEKFGIAERTVDRAVRVVKGGAPALIAAVERDEVSVSAGADLASLPLERQVEIIRSGDKQAVLQAVKAIRTERAEARRAELATVASVKAVMPPGKFGTIVIDPPWPMQKIERDLYPNQVAFDYPTMAEEELVEFGDRVNEAAGDHCHMFMWTTAKFLPMALRLLERWDFRYCLTMTWHKNGGFQPVGLPQYNAEFIVYARRGNPVFTTTKQFPICFQAPRREHSRKPDEFYDLIRRVTTGPRIDVFSREAREGFAQYGNEAGLFSGDAPEAAGDATGGEVIELPSRVEITNAVEEPEAPQTPAQRMVEQVRRLTEAAMSFETTLPRLTGDELQEIEAALAAVAGLQHAINMQNNVRRLALTRRGRSPRKAAATQKGLA